MPHFIEEDPSLEDYWRAIILFGRNVASYKFALGQSLIGLAAQGREFVTLEELAGPFAEHICTHLRDFDKQGTSGGSRFLDACREFNEDRLGLDGLRDATVRLGFNNVIDAFHVVGSGAVGQRFYEDERKSPQRGIRIREELCELVGGKQGGSLPVEVEARWRLVETAWSLEVPLRTVEVSYDKEDELLFVEDANRRRNITGCRDALSGYQKGKCFFCGGGISVVAGSSNLGEVEHLIPHTLAEHLPWTNLDGVWNLTLGCVDCNRGKGGKSAQIPALRFLERLHERNEYYIASHHPLRETVLNQTGARESLRMQFLNRVWNAANRLLGGSVPWEPA